MKAMKLAAVLFVGLALMAGCDKTYTIKVTNITSDVQQVQILQNGFPEATCDVGKDAGFIFD